MHKQREFK